MAIGPVETECRTPIMHDEGDPFAHPQRIEQRVEIASMLDQRV